MNFKLKIWRQRDAKSRGKLVDYEVRDISPDTSFLEMLDILNENLLQAGGEPVAFDSDCREGICGTCSLTVNGEAHGPGSSGRSVRALHAKISRRRDDYGRAVSRRRVSDRQRSGGRSQCARPDRASRRIHLRARRLSARGEFNSRSQTRCRPGNGGSGVHRLRRVRGGVPERIGNAFCGCESFAPFVFAAGRTRTRATRIENGAGNGCSRDLVIAPTLTSAKQCVPPRSAPVSSRSSTANTRAHNSANDSANSFARVRIVWGAHASRVLVSASRRNNLVFQPRHRAH